MVSGELFNHMYAMCTELGLSYRVRVWDAKTGVMRRHLLKPEAAL